MVIAQKATTDQLIEVMNMLKAGGNNPQVEYIMKVIKKWAKDNNIKI